MYRFGLQEKLCNLYEQSRQGKQFRHLMKLIVSEENVVLAYRNICKNKGSFTAGVDGKMLNLDEKQLAKINKFRKLAGMTEI